MSRLPSSRPAHFLVNVHLFRGVAITAVVATHVLFELAWEPARQTQFKTCLSLVQNGTVWFVFVAGLLFQHLSHGFNYGKYLASKLKYVIVPYLVVSVPYVLLQYYRGFGIFRPGAASRSPLVHATSKFVTGDQMPIPLWFVPMIAVLYLMAPALLWLMKQRWSSWLIPPLFILASFIHRPLHQTMLRQTVVYFLPVYLFGMWVSLNMTQVMAWTRRYRWWAVAVALGIVAFEVCTRQRPGAIESARPFSTEMGVFDLNNYMKLLLSLVVLEALQRCPKWLAKGLDPLARLSFGIFFVHFYWLYFARDLRPMFDIHWPGTPWMLVLITGLTLIVSVAFVELVRRLSGRWSRYLVGC